MAKIAILAQDRRQLRPMVLSSSAGINRTLDCMGFAEILDIYSDGHLPENFDPEVAAQAAESLTSMTEDETKAKQKVLEAHRILMDMNDKNRAIFQDLVKTLEND